MGSSSGGGKGDSQSQTTRLPPQLEALANRNLQGAERASQIGYTPFQGPTVSALNPLQVNSMQQNENAMRAFGMNPASVAGAIPQAKTYAGGVQGYDPMALYLQAVSKIDPAQRAAIDSFTKPGAAIPGTPKPRSSGGKGGGRTDYWER